MYHDYDIMFFEQSDRKQYMLRNLTIMGTTKLDMSTNDIFLVCCLFSRISACNAGFVLLHTHIIL